MFFGNSPRREESGQAIVLIALVVVVLLGFVGLAIDGNQMWLAQRDSQNGTDATALGAAGYVLNNYPDTVNYELWGLEAALDNGFVSDGSTTVTITALDPTHNEYGDLVYPYQATISQPQPKYFVHLFYSGPWEAVTTAIAETIIPWTETSRVTVWANATDCQNAINVAQSSVTIDGSVRSDNDLKITGENLLVDGDAYYASTFESSATVTGITIQMPTPLTPMPVLYQRTDWLPGGIYYEAARSDGMLTYIEGNKTWNTNPTPLFFEGLYVTTGSQTILGDDYVIGPKGATFVALDKLDISATSIDMRPYEKANYALLVAYGNSGCGNNSLKLAASNVTLKGVIYAPNGGIRIDAAGTYGEVAIFGYTIDLHGSALELDWLNEMTLVNPRYSRIRR